MKQYLIIIFIVLISFWEIGLAQEQNLIAIGRIDSIYSETLQEQREIWVYVPETAHLPTEPKFPVLYLLDGNAYFHSLAGIVKQPSSFGTTVCPESIIVAIPNTDRNRDLKPPDPADSANHLSGAERFMMFLENELIPFVDSKYPTLPYRTLIGHSLGGSYVINTLISHPYLFTNYLAIDPGLKFHDYRFLNQAISKIQQGNYEGKSLFVTVANTMPEGMDTLAAINDTTSITSTISSGLRFAKAIDGGFSNGLNYAWKYYPDENHLSVPIISEYDALKFFFSWSPIDLDKIIRTNPAISGERFIAKVITHFERVSENIGYAVLPSEEMINDLGYYYFNKKEYNDSFLFFAFNLKNYPESASVYGSMGEWYAAQSQTDKAIEYFNKAVEIDGSPALKAKLEKLENKDKGH